MADHVDPKADKSAEKAYAAASEAVPVKAKPAVPVEPAPMEFPAKAKRAAKSAAPAAKPSPVAAAVVEAPAPPPVLPKARKPAAKPPVAAKVRVPAPRPAAKVKPAAPAKAKLPAKAKAAAPAAKTTPPALKAQTTKPRLPAFPKPTPVLQTPDLQTKESLMDKTTDFVEGVQKTAAEAQTKAKEVLKKGGAMLGEYADFAKGNVAAVVASGKILAAGMQDAGSSMMTETKAAVETMTADAKSLAGAKSPTDFFKLQTDIMSRNFDSAIAIGTKKSEAAMKLASEVVAPISDRVTLAVAKVKAAI